MQIPDLPPSAQQVQQWTVWATVIGGAAFSVWRYAVKPKVIVPARAFSRRVQTALTTIEMVGTELGANGGRSLKDQVTRIDRNVLRGDARQLALTDALDKAMFETDDHGRWLQVSRGVCDFTGHEPQDFLGKNWINIVLDLDRGGVNREWQDAIGDQRAVRLECRMRACEGEILHVRLVADPSRDITGKIIGWFGFLEHRH